MFASIEFIFATIAWKGFGEGLWRKLSVFMYENTQAVEGTEQEQDEQESVTTLSDKSE